MKVFLRAAAVLVAWSNWYVLTTAGDPAELVEFVQERGWSGLLAPALIGAAFGLLTAEVVLRLLRAFLEGGFFARYFAMAAAMCFGGMLTGAILTFVPGAFYSGSPGLYLFVPGVVERIAGGLVVGFIGAWFGGAAGLAEGLILGFPLAGILGLFRNAH
jgi:hypothetical protein